MSQVEAVISDFGGVLTSPLLDSFAAFQDSSGVSLEELGVSMAAIAQRARANPLFEHLHPNQQMIDYMRTLRTRGVALAICTNNVREWESLWRAKLPVDEIFG